MWQGNTTRTLRLRRKLECALPFRRWTNSLVKTRNHYLKRAHLAIRHTCLHLAPLVFDPKTAAQMMLVDFHLSRVILSTSHLVVWNLSPESCAASKQHTFAAYQKVMLLIAFIYIIFRPSMLVFLMRKQRKPHMFHKRLVSWMCFSPYGQTPVYH